MAPANGDAGSRRERNQLLFRLGNERLHDVIEDLVSDDKPRGEEVLGSLGAVEVARKSH